MKDGKTSISTESIQYFHFKMRSQLYISLLSFFLLFTISGCANFNGTPYESVLGTSKSMIHIAYEIADDLEKNAYPPLIPRQRNQPILNTTFVNSHNLEETSDFSRVLQEKIASRFVQMGYTVREVKLRNELNIEQYSGELMLSRNLAEINPAQVAQAVTVGTYSLTEDVMYLSAKMIDPETSNIISSVDYKIYLDKNMLAMFGLERKVEESYEMVEEPKASFMTRLLY